MFKASIIEFLGTFFIVLALAASGSPVAVALVYMVMVYMGAHISGGQYNPALTLGLLSIGKLRVKKAFVYIIAQFLGGFAGIGMFVFFGGKNFALGPAGSATYIQSVVAEIIFSFLFISTVFFTMVHKKSAGNSYFGIAIGLSYLIGSIVIGPISGGILNPVVGIVPQVFRFVNGGGFTPENIALYTIAPILGGLAAAQFYEFIIEKHDK
jgi:aquaporin Z